MAGVGFLGAGAILKIGDRTEVHGLTTAASIWLTAAIGTGAGLGHVWLPFLGAVFGFIILGPVGRLEKRRPGRVRARPGAAVTRSARRRRRRRPRHRRRGRPCFRRV